MKVVDAVVFAESLPVPATVIRVDARRGARLCWLFFHRLRRTLINAVANRQQIIESDYGAVGGSAH